MLQIHTTFVSTLNSICCVIRLKNSTLNNIIRLPSKITVLFFIQILVKQVWGTNTPTVSLAKEGLSKLLSLGLGDPWDATP